MDVCCDLIVDALPPGKSFSALREQAAPAHVMAMLPDELRVGTLGYRLDVSMLDALESAVNDAGGNAAVEDLLRAVLPDIERWAFVFDLHCDQIDEVFEVSGVEDLLARLRTNLVWGSGRIGFIAYHLAG
jgi:hypothetical protein